MPNHPNVFVFPKPTTPAPVKTYPGYNPYRQPANRPGRAVTRPTKAYCQVCGTVHAFAPVGAAARRHSSQLFRAPRAAVVAWNTAKADAGVS